MLPHLVTHVNASICSSSPGSDLPPENYSRQCSEGDAVQDLASAAPAGMPSPAALARSCDIICDIILFAVPASRCKSLHVRLTDIFAPALVAANRCVLLQAPASSQTGFCQFEGLVREYAVEGQAALRAEVIRAQ